MAKEKTVGRTRLVTNSRESQRVEITIKREDTGSVKTRFRLLELAVPSPLDAIVRAEVDGVALNSDSAERGSGKGWLAAIILTSDM